jgi:hypothetical protein
MPVFIRRPTFPFAKQVDEEADVAERAARRVAALRQILERLEAEGRGHEASAQAVRELLTEAAQKPAGGVDSR